MTTYNFEVGACGSGWGVWDKNGKKIASVSGRYQALRYLYFLNGWDWSRSKYVRQYPELKDLKPWDGKVNI